MNGLVFAAIAPHGGIVIEEACAPEERELAAKTRGGMEELGRLFVATAPDVAVILTPHNVHVLGSMAVIGAGSIAGSLAGAAHPVQLRGPIDRVLAYSLREALAAGGVPTTEVSYGGNDAASATMPMDWATLVPYWFLGGRTNPPVPLVVMTPARDLSAEAHVHAGRIIAATARDSGKRIALIASADNGHTHTADGPYGYSPNAQEYDGLVLKAVRENFLPAVRSIDPALVAGAKADSWWQLLVLSGALEGAAWESAFLTYEAPTYFGMLTAAFTPSIVLEDR